MKAWWALAYWCLCVEIAETSEEVPARCPHHDRGANAKPIAFYPDGPPALGHTCEEYDQARKHDQQAREALRQATETEGDTAA